MIGRNEYGTMERMDKSSWLGLLVGFGAILLGNFIEGGHVSSLMQLTAGLIVLGGTIGAVMVSNPQKDLQKGMQLFKAAFRAEDEAPFRRAIDEIVDCTRLAKKESMMALDSRISRLSDPFLAKIVRTLVDGIDPQLTREIFEAEIDAEEDELLGAAKIWTDAGGYSPTIGIIGAVLGLIHVMGNLSDTSKLGAGIAVAFVATVYGVSLANLLFLPIGNKLKKRISKRIRERQVILEGALMIGSGLSSIIVHQKMKAFIDGAEKV